MTVNTCLGFASIAGYGSESDASVGDKAILRSDLTVAASGHQQNKPTRRKSAEGGCRLGVLGVVGFVGIHPHI